MFTGLIKEQGKISKIQKSSHSIKLSIKASHDLLRDYAIGDSMAVNGVCLTCVQKTSNQFTVDIMPETYKRTSFSQLKIGSLVNLEPAMSTQDRFEGHLVSGHSDGLAKLINRHKDENALLLSFSYPKTLRGQIVSQGSVTLNGVSLTVVEASEDQFSVSLIPHTAAETNLTELRAGAEVNLETDILAKYVKAQLDLRGGKW
ncbi:riboflavin synthase [Streptococcus loxodontisalivarius]|uniref:Riboflavin synthase n=1 Tax=Streptococcus loxodontisalivarius TaxID=1349415 RepID=A0ABS2PSN2_9STRE|nr:riboflavin synthase [Streptococcus loxodontisalivarius]MBM7643048.1 riboflavin synthase [Streptococcus loxodontisalivarius]